jgi:hypothetical protein
MRPPGDNSVTKHQRTDSNDQIFNCRKFHGQSGAEISKISHTIGLRKYLNENIILVCTLQKSDLKRNVFWDVVPLQPTRQWSSYSPMKISQFSTCFYAIHNTINSHLTFHHGDLNSAAVSLLRYFFQPGI